MRSCDLKAAEAAGIRIDSVMNMDHWKYLLSSSDAAVVAKSMEGMRTSLRNAKLRSEGRGGGGDSDRFGDEHGSLEISAFFERRGRGGEKHGGDADVAAECEVVGIGRGAAGAGGGECPDVLSRGVDAVADRDS